MTTFKRSAINKLSSFGLAKRGSHFSEALSPCSVTGTRIFFIQFNFYLLLFQSYNLYTVMLINKFFFFYSKDGKDSNDDSGV